MKVTPKLNDPKNDNNRRRTWWRARWKVGLCGRSGSWAGYSGPQPGAAGRLCAGQTGWRGPGVSNGAGTSYDGLAAPTSTAAARSSQPLRPTRNTALGTRPKLTALCRMACLFLLNDLFVRNCLGNSSRQARRPSPFRRCADQVELGYTRGVLVAYLPKCGACLGRHPSDGVDLRRYGDGRLAPDRPDPATPPPGLLHVSARQSALLHGRRARALVYVCMCVCVLCPAVGVDSWHWRAGGGQGVATVGGRRAPPRRPTADNAAATARGVANANRPGLFL